MQAEQQSERERFEEWATDKGIDLETHDSDGEYLWGPARDTWDAWQARAALSHPSTPQGWTDEAIEALAVKHEAFGFGRVDAKGFTTHGFDPDGLHAFVRELLGPPPPEQGGRNA